MIWGGSRVTPERCDVESTTANGCYKVTPTEGRWGDVDKNGDLVDELDQRLGECIVAASQGLADDQLRAVRTMLGRRAAP
jgi:hypothetical protein